MATLSYIAEHRDTASAEQPTTAATAQSRRSSLLFRFLLLNILALALLGAAAFEGYVDMVVSADKTRLSVAIFVVFVVGLCISTLRAWQIHQEIDKLSRIPADDSQSPTTSMGSLRLQLTQRIASVRHIANTLVLLGLIGTVLGFIIALSGVDPNTASDVNSIAPMVTVLIQGMSTALYTTLIGSVLNVWLTANYQILAGGTVQLMSLWLDRTENNA